MDWMGRLGRAKDNSDFNLFWRRPTDRPADRPKVNDDDGMLRGRCGATYYLHSAAQAGRQVGEGARGGGGVKRKGTVGSLETYLPEQDVNVVVDRVDRLF